MKLSNNAIKFLMAQYRAIYKNAYFKGLATAVVLTAGLAATQAHAAAIDISSGKAEVGSGDTIAEIIIGEAGSDTEIKGKAKNDASLDVAGGIDIAAGKTLTLGSGAQGGHGFTTTVAGAANVAGTLKIVAGATAIVGGSGSNDIKATFNDNLTIGGDLQILSSAESGAATLIVADSKVLTINGTASATGTKSKEAKIEAGQITLGEGAKVTLKGASGGSGSMGKATTVYTLANGSEIDVGESGSLTGAKLISSGGTIKFAGDENFTLATYIQGDNKGTAQKVNITSSGAITVKATPGASARGVLHLADGSAINANKLVIDSGTANFGSVVVLDSGVTLSTREIEVAGAGAGNSGSLLKSDAEVIGNYVGSNNKLLLKANSALELTGKSVALTSGTAVADHVSLTLASGSAGVEGQVVLAAAAQISAENLTIAEKLADKLNNKLTVAATNNLTLGSDSYTNADALNFSGAATAKNLITKGAGNSFSLADDVTLTAMDGSEAAEGSISGANLKLVGNGKALKIDGGNYTTDVSIDIGSGSLTVDGNTGSREASLAMNGGTLTLVQDTAIGGSVTVDGAKAVLDLSNATVEYGEGTSKAVAINANNGSTLKINGDSLSGLLSRAATESGAQFTVSGASTMEVVGSLDLNKSHLGTSQIQTSEAKTGISLSGDTAQFKVTDTLTVKEGTELNLEATGRGITAGVLAFTGAGDAYTVLKSGTYTAINGLTTDAATGFNVSGDATVNLGLLEDVLTEDGKVDYTNGIGGGDLSAVTLSGGNLAVNAGTWNAGKGITVTTGKLTVGQSGAKVDVDGVPIKASLNATGNLEANVASGADVTRLGTLTAAGLKAVTSGVNVAGSLIINSKYDAAGTDAYAKTGLSLEDNSVTIAAGGTVTLGGEGALTALGINGKKTVKAVDISCTL